MFKLIKTFTLGVWEFRRSWTWCDPARSDDEPYTHLDEAYDKGRDFAHLITFRFWDN